MAKVKHVYKYLIAAVSFLVAGGVSLGAVKLYSDNSSQTKGALNPAENELVNVFLAKDSSPELKFLLQDKKTSVASFGKYQDGQDNLDRVTYNGKSYEYEDFFNVFYLQNGFLPVLEISYGSFKFYNEYLEAVPPHEFLKFAQWFVKNVSWGPDMLTLKSFSIVKGVQRDGNSITLGQHLNANKELQTIKFYPDAFFGSLSLYSFLAGEGNLQDSLLYRLNSVSITEEELDFFLKNAKKLNILANEPRNTQQSNIKFRNLLAAQRLQNRKLYVYSDLEAGVKQVVFLKEYDPESTSSQSEAQARLRDLLKDPSFVFDSSKLKEYYVSGLGMANADLLSKTYPELASLDLTPSEEKETDLKNLPVTRNGRMALYLRFVDAAKGDGAIEAAKKAEEALEAKVLEDLQTNANDTDAKAKVAAELDAIKKALYTPDETLLITDYDYSAQALSNLDELEKYEFSQPTVDFLDYYDLKSLVGKTFNLYQSPQPQQDQSESQEQSETQEQSSTENTENTAPAVAPGFPGATQPATPQTSLMVPEAPVKSDATDAMAATVVDLNDKKNLTLFSPNGKEVEFAKNYASLVDERNFKDPETGKVDFPTFDTNLLSQARVSDLSVENGVLTVDLLTHNAKYRYSVDAKSMSDRDWDFVQELFSKAGYVKYLDPYLVNLDSDIVTPEGKRERTFTLYYSAYQNLLDNISRKMPYLLSDRTGPHVVKKVNDQGVVEYKLEDGPYKGFSSDDNIGLWAVLKLSDPKFKGMSSDFLRFVGAHEYGHHITLTGAQDLGDKQYDPVLASAQSPRGATNIQNFISKENLDLYLRARTHLEAKTTNLYAQGEKEINSLPESNTGNFVNYGFQKKDGSYAYETQSDVWGAPKADPSIVRALTNPKRRFLQNFEGLQKALQERKKDYNLSDNVDLFDLWLTNAFDEQSGTLNPTIEGTAQYFQVDTSSPTGYTFKDASNDQIKDYLKDGLGQKIEYSNGGFVLFKFVPYDPQNGLFKLTSNKVRRENGELYVNIPEGSVLTTVQFSELKRIEREFNENVNNFIVKRFSSNGWNTGTAITDTNVQITNAVPYSLRYTSQDELVNGEYSKATEFYKNFVNKRSWTNGLFGNDEFTFRTAEADDYNITYWPLYFAKTSFYGPESYRNALIFDEGALTKTREYAYNFPVRFPGLSIAEVNETLTEFSTLFPRTLTPQERSAKQNQIRTEAERRKVFDVFMQTSYAWRGHLPEYNVVDTLGGNKLFLNSTHQYVPNFAQRRVVYNTNTKETTYKDPYKSSSFLNNTPISISNVVNGLVWFKNLNGRIYSDYAPWMRPIGAVDNDGQQFATAYFFADENGTEIEAESPDETTKVDLSKRNAQTLVVNTDFGVSDVQNGVFGAIKLSPGKDKRVLNDLEEMLDFMTVDYEKAKATYDAATKQQVLSWDIDYVEARLDLETFRSRYLSFLQNYKGRLFTNKERQDLIDLYSKPLSETKQEVANQAMQRFLRSGYVPFAKDYQLKDFLAKRDNLWVLDKNVGVDNLKSSFVDLTVTDADDNRNVDRYLKFVKEYFDKHQIMYDNLTLFDLHLLTGITWFLPDAKTSRGFVNKEAGQLTVRNGVSSDVDLYFSTKISSETGSIFSDYVYSYAEQINRDYLQTTYTPSYDQYGNRPDYISGITEVTTGLEYIVDATASNKYQNFQVDSEVTNNMLTSNVIPYYVEQNNRNRAAKNGLPNYESSKRDNYFYWLPKYTNNFFGKIRSFNNGWYKDRFYRTKLNWELYDEHGLDKQDNSIRIKDLLGQTVTSRAKAYWQYLIQSQGIGDRTLSGFWRDSDKDAVAFYGYFDLEKSQDLKYLAFENTITKEVSYLSVHVSHTNNLFYYTKQAPENGYTDVNRHYIKDEPYFDKKTNTQRVGFASWVSDYALVSQYRNRLVSPGNTYNVYFANSNKEKLEDVDLGSLVSMAENGKLFNQSPLTVQKVENTDGTHSAVLNVKDQFNSN
ncbi:PDxFFG protein [Mycoplasmopsis synoviae]|uniref:PDxFFG protein n=1 Tax=Mycoplasmopsis synoviae TaxID=2109 RepID=UPI001C58F9BA|nr:PDxFFG protein [Mycoplasmopsis synoviae]QXV99656.1 PDxFFG protein [Mycoplasmopsis synoviae]UBM43831.1 PDxFFG protein [Mycoplasmopsis synoviae]UZW63963.1 PDxFFG protein [Mycoplasmopsis synoviae]